jgi:hypothetical protein
MGNEISLKWYLISFLLAGLFLVSLFNFGIGLKTEYNQTNNLIDSDKIPLSQIEGNLTKAQENSEKWQRSLSSDSLFVKTGTIVVYSIWSVIKLVWGSINALMSLMFTTASTVFGIDPMVVGVVIAIIIMGIIFAIWRTIRLGE